jgi:hypothetical protein
MIVFCAGFQYFREEFDAKTGTLKGPGNMKSSKKLVFKVPDYNAQAFLDSPESPEESGSFEGRRPSTPRVTPEKR